MRFTANRKAQFHTFGDLQRTSRSYYHAIVGGVNDLTEERLSAELFYPVISQGEKPRTLA